MPLRPIISSIGSVTYAIAKELSKILKPLLGRSPHHAMNNQDFLESIRGIQLLPEECMVSYDVEALFTSVPVESAISIIKAPRRRQRVISKNSNVREPDLLLAKILSEYHLFHIPGEDLWTGHGSSHGVSLKPHSGQSFYGKPGNKSPGHSTIHPKIWKRFVDDTFTIIQKADKDALLNHINSIDENIYFTYEDPKEDGSIPFLDMLIIPDEEGRLNTNVYRKPTHTDQYLHWDSHHAITSKYSVIGTQYHRARTVCSNPDQLPKWRETFIQIPEQMQVSKLGTKQSEDKEPNISPKEKQ